MSDGRAGRETNFDIIRLIAAMLVMVTHSFAWCGVDDPVFKYLGHVQTASGIGVAAFFVISGYFVTASVIYRQTTEYFISRCLRIFPALAVVVLAAVFLIGPVMTTLPMSDYFSSGQTWRYLGTMSALKLSFHLPGVFATNPDPGVNGSLWTLPFEATFYLLLPFLAAAKLWRPQIVAALFIFSLASLIYMDGWLGFNYAKPGYVVSEGVLLYPLAIFSACFCAGAFLQLARKYVPMNDALALAACVLMVVSWAGVTKTAVFYLTLPYLVIYAGTRSGIAVTAMKKLGDISYGIYIWAFPVQQIVFAKMHPHNPGVILAISLPVVFVISVASWHFIEKPALALKSAFRLRLPQAPANEVAQPTSA